jgi:hypothetical protein
LGASSPRNSWLYSSHVSQTVIGAGSTIGGNVFLTTSVPANSLVTFEGLTMKVMSKADRLLHKGDFQI